MIGHHERTIRISFIISLSLVMARNIEESYTKVAEEGTDESKRFDWFFVQKTYQCNGLPPQGSLKNRGPSR